MSDVERNSVEQQFTGSMRHVRDERLAAATPVGVLSDRGDKLLEVLEEPSGERFVRRSFSSAAVSDMEGWSGLEFGRVWHTMNELFAGENVRLVPSSLIYTGSEEYPYVVVSEYIEDGVDLRDAPLESKKAAVRGLGQALIGNRSYVPSPEVIQDHMFQVVERNDGEPEVLLLDVDPRLQDCFGRRSDNLDSIYVTRVTDRIWDTWGTEKDRAELAHAFMMSIASLFNERTGDLTFDALASLHTMSQGFDKRRRYSDLDLDEVDA